MLIGAAGFGAEEQVHAVRSMVDRQVDGPILIARVSLVGYNNTALAELAPGRLTSVDQA